MSLSVIDQVSTSSCLFTTIKNCFDKFDYPKSIHLLSPMVLAFALATNSLAHPTPGLNSHP